MSRSQLQAVYNGVVRVLQNVPVTCSNYAKILYGSGKDIKDRVNSFVPIVLNTNKKT